MVTYTFTNNSDEATSFMVALYPKVFQNGVELGTAIEDGFCDPTGSGGIMKLAFDIPFDLLEVA